MTLTTAWAIILTTTIIRIPKSRLGWSGEWTFDPARQDSLGLNGLSIFRLAANLIKFLPLPLLLSSLRTFACLPSCFCFLSFCLSDFCDFASPFFFLSLVFDIATSMFLRTCFALSFFLVCWFVNLLLFISLFFFFKDSDCRRRHCRLRNLPSCPCSLLNTCQIQIC